MKITIKSTVNNDGYWITSDNISVFNTNIKLGLEEISDSFNNQIKNLQEEIKKLQLRKEEVDQELKKRGGKYRPRQVAIPESDIWFSECFICKKNNVKLNMTAWQLDSGIVNTYCFKCHHKQFSKHINE